jgi:predicted metal-dependent TIM-barrel fold hydrolase
MNQISGQWRFIDSHVHLDMTHRIYPDLISRLKEVGCIAVSWAFAPQVKDISDLDHYFKVQKETIHKIRLGGNRCYFLAGLHPRNIPGDIKPEVIRELLIPSLEDEYCLGVGEIGLEKGTEHEKEILLAQLDMAEEVVSHGKIFGIHTPRENKEFLTKETLTLLRPYLSFREKIVIDHCNINTIQSVLESGFWAGVTISPIKTSFQDLKKIIYSHPESLERIMLNTDSGGHFYDDLIRFYGSEQFEQKIREQLANLSAARFFGL